MNTSWDLIENYTDIKYEKGLNDTFGIIRITINRPKVRNAFRPKTIKELKDAFERAREDSDCGVIILTGEEKDKEITEKIYHGIIITYRQRY